MQTYELERQQWIPRPLPELFAFFSRVENLERITPDWVHFRIHSPLPIAMREGARIEYGLRLAGVPLRWRTRIVEWMPETRFVDEQERGPYALWRHTHVFEPLGAGVLMTDHVLYALPFGPLGRITHAVAVRAALAAIFDQRFRRIRELLPP